MAFGIDLRYTLWPCRCDRYLYVVFHRWPLSIGMTVLDASGRVSCRGTVDRFDWNPTSGVAVHGGASMPVALIASLASACRSRFGVPPESRAAIPGASARAGFRSR